MIKDGLLERRTSRTIAGYSEETLLRTISKSSILSFLFGNLFGNFFGSKLFPQNIQISRAWFETCFRNWVLLYMSWSACPFRTRWLFRIFINLDSLFAFAFSYFFYSASILKLKQKVFEDNGSPSCTLLPLHQEQAVPQVSLLQRCSWSQDQNLRSRKEESRSRWVSRVCSSYIKWTWTSLVWSSRGCSHLCQQVRHLVLDFILG